MLDSFDYKEPTCALCGGKEFYNPKQNTPDGTVEIKRILEKVDALFNKNDYDGGGRLLEYWLAEAISLKDKMGELALTSELIGYYRKVNDKNKGLKAVNRGIELVKELNQEDLVSGATVYLNCATAYKAFGELDNSINYFKLAEGVYLKVLESSDARLAGLYNNMALTLVDLDKLEEANSAYQKAITVMQNIKGGELDLAITYVNLAHLHYILQDKKAVTDCLFKAYNLINEESLKKNGYYAYVCQKCAPSFEFFGYDVISKELNDLAERIYERS